MNDEQVAAIITALVHKYMEVEDGSGRASQQGTDVPVGGVST